MTIGPPQAVLEYFISLVNHYSSDISSANNRNQYVGGGSQNESHQAKTPVHYNSPASVQNVLNYDSSNNATTSSSASCGGGAGFAKNAAINSSDKNMRRGSVNEHNLLAAAQQQQQDGSKSASPRDTKSGLPFPMLPPPIESVEANKATTTGGYTQPVNSITDSMVWTEGEAITPTIPAVC